MKEYDGTRNVEGKLGKREKKKVLPTRDFAIWQGRALLVLTVYLAFLVAVVLCGHAYFILVNLGFIWDFS